MIDNIKYIFREKVEDCVSEEVWDEVVSRVYDQVWDEVGSVVVNQVTDELRNLILAEVWVIATLVKEHLQGF